MTAPSNALVVGSMFLSIFLRRDHGDAVALLYIESNRVAVVGLVGENKTAFDQSSHGIHGTDTVMLISTNQKNGQGQSDDVHSHGQLGIVAALGLSKLLALQAIANVLPRPDGP